MVTKVTRPTSRSAPPSTIQTIPTDILEERLRGIDVKMKNLEYSIQDLQQAKDDLRSATDPDSVRARNAYRITIPELIGEKSRLEQERSEVQCELDRREQMREK